MYILSLDLESWYLLIVSINWLVLLIFIGIVLLFLKSKKLISKWLSYLGKEVDVDELSLGIGSNKVTLKVTRKDQEIAYKLWVELTTRKIGLEFDKDYDVIIEIYNSWYSFFGIARELLKEMPCEKLKHNENLVILTIEVLNLGLRPHLTQWQAKFRKWYDIECKNHENLSPQIIQKRYSEYDLLLTDLIETNKRMINYCNLMKKIAFKL